MKTLLFVGEQATYALMAWFALGTILAQVFPKWCARVRADVERWRR